MNHVIEYKTDKQIKTTVWRFHAMVWLVGAALLALCIGGYWLQTVWDEQQVKQHMVNSYVYIMPIAAGTLFGALLMAWLHNLVPLAKYCSTRPLQGKHCLTMDKLMQEHPEVANYIEAVNAQRSVQMFDLFHIENWLARAPMREYALAYSRVHGLA